MPSQIERENGCKAIREIIREIAQDPNRVSAQAKFRVSAEVAGKTVFDDYAECFFVIDHDDGKVSIYWEGAGFPDYKSRGLFGQMKAHYQTIKMLRSGILSISDKFHKYSIRINYLS